MHHETLPNSKEDNTRSLPDWDQIEPFGLDAMIIITPRSPLDPLASTESITWTDKVTDEGDTYQAVDGTAKRD